MSVLSDPLFLTDYTDARARFVRAAQGVGAETWNVAHPRLGLRGEPLLMDFAWMGPRDASKVMVSLSGTHGVEGICGSACQAAWLEQATGQATNLPSDCAIFWVHAVNPYGFSWLRRVDHEHIDVNRNAVDPTAPHPINPDYEKVHDLLLPTRWDSLQVSAIFEGLKSLMARLGTRAATRAITGGQYTHPNGLFFGGQHTSWSCEVLQREAEQHLQVARVVAVLDHHTGLGPLGHTEIICRHAVDSPAHSLAKRWWGTDMTTTDLGESESEVIDGNVRMAFMRWCPRALVVSAALEVGTQTPQQVLAALIGDHWLHQRGLPSSKQGDVIRGQVKDAFFVDTLQWRLQSVSTSLALYAHTLRGLGAMTFPHSP